MVALACYRLLGGSSLLQGEINWPAYCAMFLTFMLVNSALVSEVIALNQRQRFATVWRTTAGQALVYDLMSLPLPFIFSVVYVHFGTIGAVALAIEQAVGENESGSPAAHGRRDGGSRPVYFWALNTRFSQC
jgi:hypothetical protein